MHNFECKFNSTICNSNQKCNNEIWQCEYKNYRNFKNDYNWNPSRCTCENSQYLESVADTSLIVRNKITNATDNVSTNTANNILSNVRRTVVKHSHEKKVK